MARPRWIPVGMLVLGLAAAVPGRSATELSFPSAGPGGQLRLTSSVRTNSVIQLESSLDLQQWREVGRALDGLKAFPDLSTPDSLPRFYRTREWTRTAADDWSNQIGYAGESLRSPEPGFYTPASRWVKFALLLSDPHRVWFQDSTKYPFHHEFAVARLPGFEGMKRVEFDRVSLHTNGQRVVLGAVLYPPLAAIPEVGIQFAGLDPFPPERVAEWYRTVRAFLDLPPGIIDYYLPTYEQTPVTTAHPEFFATLGIRVGSPARWVTADEIYASGWAVGRLNFVSVDEIPYAYRDGRLLPDDILLTDRLPAEVPPVAGIITLSPATPNSHVALLAASFGVPCVYFADPRLQAELLLLSGQDVSVRTTPISSQAVPSVLDLDGQLTADHKFDFWLMKRPLPLSITPKTPRGQLIVDVDTLHPADVRFVGGKAANYGVLRRSIPGLTPQALAFTFDLWDEFLQQVLPGGLTLREAVRARLSRFSWPPADMATLQTELAAVRDLFTDLADFTPAQKELILAELLVFEPGRKIRFRSSTNVEDTKEFIGAGLYDSYSGCLGDDLDGDEAGPSGCDPSESRERGVFRAMRKVYASFYNDNAFIERLRRSVDESQVGMGILVHYSFPDDIEMANGVAALHATRRSGGDGLDLRGTLVTQLGAESVSNPDSTARPEQVELWSAGGASPYFDVVQHSTLVPLGGTVMTWTADYLELVNGLSRAAAGYEAEFPDRNEFWLDLEYKKVQPGVIEIKQIREIPQPPTGARSTPFLVTITNRFEVLQGAGADLLSLHRLKSEWVFQTRTAWLTASNLEQSLLQTVKAQLLSGTNQVALEGPISQLPGYQFERLAGASADRWSLASATESRIDELRVETPADLAAAAGPVISLADADVTFRTEYLVPRPSIGFDETVSWVTNESVRLQLASRVTAESVLQSRELQSGALRVQTAFFWPPPPKGPVAGYTAPLQAWKSTTVHGLTAQALELQSPWAQTYLPGHHNFVEQFLFDPFLEPGTSPEQRAELRQRNIRGLIATAALGEAPSFLLWGWDGTFRKP